MDNNPLPYGDDIIDLKTDEINKSYNDDSNNYIGTEHRSCGPRRVLHSHHSKDYQTET